MLYQKPVEKITWDDVVAFCEQRPAENSFLDYKRDFPKDLGKTIAAMANTLGGIVLIGVEEDEQGKPRLPLRGIDFERGLRERVTSIILSNIAPPIFPEIQDVLNETGDKALIIIRVPQSHQTPHAILGNTQVYLRTGNLNKPEELATLDDIDWLREHRGKSEELRQFLYSQAEERFTSLYDFERRRIKSQGAEVKEVKDGLLTLTACPYYPQRALSTPPLLARSVYEKTRVRDYTNMSFYFPAPFEQMPRIVQDGLARTWVGSAPNGDTIVFHSELNEYGLYVYKQSLLRSFNSASCVRLTDIFARFDQFVDSATQLYGELGYWGLLQLRMLVQNVRNYPFLSPVGRYGPGPELLHSPDATIEFTEVLRSGTLQESKPRLILSGAQRVAWAVGWDLQKQALDEIFAGLRRS